MLQSNASVWCGYSARLFGQTTPEQTHVVSAGSFSAGCLFRTPSHHRSERGPYLVTTVKIQAAISVLLDMGAMAPSRWCAPFLISFLLHTRGMRSRPYRPCCRAPSLVNAEASASDS
jgi:hypothetical protein